MKNPDLTEQKNRNVASFAFLNFCAQSSKQRLYLAPRNTGGYRTLKNLLQSGGMFFVHAWMIAKSQVQNPAPRDGEKARQNADGVLHFARRQSAAVHPHNRRTP